MNKKQKDLNDILNDLGDAFSCLDRAAFTAWLNNDKTSHDIIKVIMFNVNREFDRLCKIYEDTFHGLKK